VEVAEGLKRSGPISLREQAWYLAQEEASLGEFLLLCGRPAEALRALERACACWETIRRGWRGFGEAHDFWCDYACALALMGRLQVAAGRRDEAARALEQARGHIERADAAQVPYSQMPWFLGRARGQVASLIGLGREGLTAEERAERQALTDRAFAELRQVVAGGYKDLVYLRASPAWDALRSRPDFQLLLLDLAFPKWPFAAEPPVTSP
jgi:hypothetical protein